MTGTAGDSKTGAQPGIAWDPFDATRFDPAHRKQGRQKRRYNRRLEKRHTAGAGYRRGRDRRRAGGSGCGAVP